ncbi:MAG: DUF4389 domain-containing protein [Candidatus Marithrix sp.]|nr:DUF4389 domain-containing protein [Candidatus Marithrix sp.]
MTMTRKEMQENVLEIDTWIRGFFMIIYTVFCYIAINILVFVVVINFAVVLLSGQPNDKLLYFGDILSTYIYQTVMYLTYNTDIKPFPFGDGISTDDLADFPDEEPPHKYHN